MKEIKTADAVGHVLCHDITQIIRGVTKDARFRKGHIVTAEDIPVLLSLGKENLYVWEKNENMLHEDEAADILRSLCQSAGMEATLPKEGKIELKATVDGVLEIDTERLDAINDFEEIMIATLSQHEPVRVGDKLAGMRIIPLLIAKETMAQVKSTAGSRPLLRIEPYKDCKVGVINTGTEVFSGLIKDTFTPVLESKLHQFGAAINEHRTANDDPKMISGFIRELLDLGMDLIICTGGMSVDPDDKTPAAIRAAGAKVVTYGAPVLPGAMFLLAYCERDGKKRPVIGLPGCAMYAPTTVLDIFLPRLLAGIPISRRDIRSLGAGGLCRGCKTCHYPACDFGKGGH